MSGLTAEPRKDNGIFYAIGTIGGERIRKSLGTRDPTRAEELRAHLESRLWKRHCYGEGAVRTFEEAALRYMEQGGERRFLPPLIKRFKGRNLASIQPGEIREAAIALYPHAGPATRNRQAISPARAVVMFAHDLGWCGAIKVKQFDVPRSRKHKPVDRAWLDAFMAEADRSGLPHLSALVLFMHQTGARVSEAINLLGEHVDLGRSVAVLAKTKTDEWSPRQLPAELVGRIAALRPAAGHRVFLYSDRTAVRNRMQAVCRRAGIEYRSTHSAGRHSFATFAMNEGAKLKDVMDAGNWKSAKLFLETYVHSQEAGQKVAALFDRQKGPIGNVLTQGDQRFRSRFGKRK